MATEADLEQLRQDLTGRANDLEQTLENYNNDLQSSILRLNQALQINIPHHTNEEDNMDILEPMFKLGGTIYKRHRIYERNLLS